MDFTAAFPLRFWINLGRREDRRVETEGRLAEAGVIAERFAAVEVKATSGNRFPTRNVEGEKAVGVKWATPPGEVRGYNSAGRYALALTQRLAIREAKRRNAPAVLLLEDDVVFHPNFRALIQMVELPEDWGIFYLGCSHHIPPTWTGARVVRCDSAVDTHAVAIRAPYYDRVMEMLDRHGKPDAGVSKASDRFLALLHREIPTYACYPNLVWQDVSPSDLMNSVYSNYTRDGRQKNLPVVVAGLLNEVVGREEPEGMDRVQEAINPIQGKGKSDGLNLMSQLPPTQDEPEVDQSRMPRRRSRRARLGLLFLTRGDVNHPEVWREFVDEAPERVRVFSHPKFPGQLEGGFLEGTAIPERFDTRWGDISLVRASRAMLLSALEDERLTHFALLSESCVPVRPLPEILRRLELDPRPQFGFRTLKEANARHAVRIGAVPEVPAGCWRFTSQWWLLDRAAAVFATALDYTPLFEKMFAPDEAYFATVLAMQAYPLDGEVLRRDVTWTSWDTGAGSPTSWPKLPMEQLEGLLHSGALFARKFPQGADVGKFALHCSALPAVR